jgi:hypothetical protein
MVTNHLVPPLGKMPLDEITLPAIMDWGATTRKGTTVYVHLLD